MSLRLTPDDSYALWLGYEWGLLSRDYITKYAESLISESAEIPSADLCELALGQNNKITERALKLFGPPTEKWAPIKILFEDHIEFDRLSKALRYRFYYGVSNYIDWNDLDPWKKIKIRCHELSDARAGTFGDEETLDREIGDLIRHA